MHEEEIINTNEDYGFKQIEERYAILEGYFIFLSVTVWKVTFPPVVWNKVMRRSSVNENFDSCSAYFMPLRKSDYLKEEKT